MRVLTAGFCFAIAVLMALVVDERGRAAARADEKKAAAGHAFPRLDGVYRVKRRTAYVGQPNRDVYDYLAFGAGGKGYAIKGDYGIITEAGKVRRGFYLEQPEGKIPGAFHTLPAELDDQPALIRKWLADPKMKPPLGGGYEAKGEGVVLVVNDPGTPSGNPSTVTYTATSGAKGVKVMVKRADGRGKTLEEREEEYEFVPVK